MSEGKAGAEIKKGGGVDMAVRWHVYISDGKAIDTVTAGNGAKAGRWLCAMASL